MSKLLTTDFVVGVFLGVSLVTCVVLGQSDLAGQIASGLTGFLGRAALEQKHNT